MKKLLPIALLLAAASCKEELVCPSGETACGGTCVSLLTDPANCGSCGDAVGPLASCVDGARACAPGVGICGATCTDLARDPAHCGGCDVACTSGQLCSTAAAGT